jgi:hypothetical protein
MEELFSEDDASEDDGGSSLFGEMSEEEEEDAEEVSFLGSPHATGEKERSASSHPQKVGMEDFVLLKTIGKGSFGKVSLCAPLLIADAL